MIFEKFLSKNNNIYLATQNKHKHKEISIIFKDLGFKAPQISPQKIEVEEYGRTFEENSLIKALTFANALQKPVLADDSGLIIDALPGELGIYSARYKAELTQEEKNKDIIKRLKTIPKEKRTARFVSLVTLHDPVLQISISAKGIFEGYIADKISGNGGFGYDPIFIPKEYNVSVAELSEDLKNKISHRANAINKLINICNNKI